MPDYITNPRQIQSWLAMAAPQVRTIEDFVCCLPDDFKKNYVVAHTSLSAQTGTPVSPRVLMFSKSDGSSKNPRLVLSINGGGPINQAQNVEMAYFNPQTKQLEYFDLSFDEIAKKTSLSKTNPDTCMNCHGDGGVAPKGGPKFIFDSFPHWPRFVGGADSCHNTDSLRDDLAQDAVSDRAIQTIKENPRFSCLDKAPLHSDPTKSSPSERYSKLGSNTANFDLSFSEQRGRQSFNWFKSQKEYNQGKYFLASANLCSPLNFRDWFPQWFYDKAVKNLDIDPELKKDGDVKENFWIAMKKEQAALKAKRDQNDQALKTGRIFKDGISPVNSPLACLPTDENSLKQLVFRNFSVVEKISGAQYKQQLASHDPQLLIDLNAQIHGTNSNQGLPSSELQFFFSGTNLSTYLIQSSARPGDLLRGNIEAKQILDAEDKDSTLLSLFSVGTKCPPNTHCILSSEESKVYIPRDPKNICSSLQRLSVAAFTQPSSDKKSSLGAR